MKRLLALGCAFTLLTLTAYAMPGNPTYPLKHTGSYNEQYMDRLSCTFKTIIETVACNSWPDSTIKDIPNILPGGLNGRSSSENADSR